MAEIAAKIKQRSGHRAYVTKTINTVKDLLQNFNENEQTRSQLGSFRKGLNDKIDVLCVLDEAILNSYSDDGQIEDEILSSSEFKDKIQEAVIAIDLKLNVNVVSDDDLGSSAASSASDSSGKSKFNYAKLPKLTLKSFDGNPMDFQSFWDSFKAAIHENDALEKIAKFNYLKNYLKGQAANSISGLTLSSENYDEAINILNKRFGNKQLLISSHIEKLISYKKTDEW